MTKRKKNKKNAAHNRPAPAARAEEPAAAVHDNWAHGDFTKAPKAIRTVAENLDALFVALIMALIVRGFCLEAFTIPSDSMFPTLNGEVGVMGDRVIVNKVRPLLGFEPRRWDVTVFRYPLDSNYRNFIKRLVGLPGERLTAVDGDLWVNQKIERKPNRVQRAIWIERFPRVPDYMRPPGPCSWTARDRGWKGSGRSFSGTPPAGKPLGLDFVFGGGLMDGDPNRPRPDDIKYTHVRDYRVRGELTASAGATATVELTVRDIPFKVVLPTNGTARVEFPTGSDAYTVAAVEESGKDRSLPAGAAVDFEVSHWDWQLEVRIDGDVWFRYQLDPAAWTKPEWPKMYGVKDNALSLTAAGGPVTFDDLAVDQDLHYTQRDAFDVNIPEDHFFMMGDNSHGSRDSRMWHRIQVKDPKTGKLIWGEEYSVHLDSDAPYSEAEVNFVDLYHNPYFIPNFNTNDPLNKYGASPAVIKWEHYGFIPRKNIVGRGFCVFWPIWPLSDDFQPKLIR